MYTSVDAKRNTRLLNVSVDFGLDRLLKTTATTASQSKIKMPSLDDVPSSSSSAPRLNASDLQELKTSNIRNFTNSKVFYPNGYTPMSPTIPYINAHAHDNANQLSSYVLDSSITTADVDPMHASSLGLNNNLIEGSQESDFQHRAPSPPPIVARTDQNLVVASSVSDKRAQSAIPSQSRSSVRMQRQHQTQQSQQQQPSKSYAGYKFTSLDHFKAIAYETLLDEKSRKDLMNSAEFLEILKAQQNAVSFGIDLKKMIAKEFKEKGSYAAENEFILDIVTLALSEMEQNNLFAQSVEIQSAISKREIEETMSKLLKREDQRRERLEFFADKVLDTKHKIKVINDTKKAYLEHRRAELLDRDKRDKERKSDQNNNAAAELQAQITEKQTRRNEKINERMSYVTDMYNKKLERMSTTQTKMELEREEQQKRRQAATMSASSSFTRAKEMDQEKRVNSKREHDFKDARFHRNFDRFKSGRQAHLDKLSESQQRKIFAANQRRRAKENEKAQQLELTKIKFSKVDGASEISRSVGSQRKYMMHTTLVNKLGQPGQADDLLDITPGPGEYSPKQVSTVRCGKFGLAGSRPSSILAPPPSPGPMDYNIENRPSSQGVIPFMGRGKDDTDILIARAQLLPGVGDYNLPQNQSKGGKIPAAVVPSSIEVLLRQKRGSPGMYQSNLNLHLLCIYTLFNS